MSEEILLVRYGLLRSGQALESQDLKTGRSVSGYFWGTLFEGRQRVPLENGACHYPVAVLSPAQVKIRCELGQHRVSDPKAFWDDLFAREMYFPHLPPDRSLMHLAHTTVFLDDARTAEAPVFVLNPLFYLFHRPAYALELIPVAANSEGFVDWLQVPPWTRPKTTSFASPSRGSSSQDG